jgi:phosphoserine aminotransferase
MTNLNVISDWLQDNNDFEFLVKNPLWRSSTSVCVKIVAKWFKELDGEKQLDVAIKLSSLLEEMDIAYDIGSYRDAPPGLRIWAGSTVDPINLKLLFPWLEWGLYQVKSEYNN